MTIAWTPGLVILIGTIIVACGTYWQFHRQAESTRLLLKQSQEIADLNKALAQKSDEIAELNRNIVSSVTGGDSFSYLALFGMTDAAGPQVIVVQMGKYPLYDVAARVVDLDKWEAERGSVMTLEKLQALDAHLTVGNIAAGASVTAGRLTRLNPTRQYRYNVFFSARNGF